MQIALLLILLHKLASPTPKVLAFHASGLHQEILSISQRMKRIPFLVVSEKLKRFPLRKHFNTTFTSYLNLYSPP